MQHCILNLFEKYGNSVDNVKSFGNLLLDLSKALDYFGHELLTEKLDAYGFSLTALRLINDLFVKQKTKNKD